MTAAKAESTSAGVRFEGGWSEVCSFAENIEDIMKDNVNDDETIEEYNDWRPRKEEDEEKISKKTAKRASIQEKEVEEEYKGANEELKQAGKKVKNGIENTIDKEKSSTDELKDASKSLERLVGAKALNSIRKMERTIYERIMLRFNPYYFDTEYFSANLKEKEDNYRFTVNVSEGDLREKVKENLKEENKLSE